jgi:dolichol kinase
MDVLSKKRNKAQFFVRLIFGRTLRRHEVEKEYTLNGASWVLISATFGILVFPKIIFITGFSILILSDIAACLFGRKFGKTPLFDKSWEGTSAFIIIAFFIVSFIGYMNSAPWTFFVFGFISAFLGGMVEAASRILKVDDNITIPICIGVLMWIGEYVSVYLFNLSYINLLN